MRDRIKAAAIGTTAGLLVTTEVAAQSLRDRFFGDDEEFIDVASASNGGVATVSPTAARSRSVPSIAAETPAVQSGLVTR